ncbi:hypothetical protein ADK74_26205 [Streptomyces decoyicus]|nr:hypothetical protein ADK74_26205 [Streptomyces decoyicus]
MPERRRITHRSGLDRGRTRRAPAVVRLDRLTAQRVAGLPGQGERDALEVRENMCTGPAGQLARLPHPVVAQTGQQGPQPLLARLDRSPYRLGRQRMLMRHGHGGPFVHALRHAGRAPANTGGPQSS